MECVVCYDSIESNQWRCKRCESSLHINCLFDMAMYKAAHLHVMGGQVVHNTLEEEKSLFWATCPVCKLQLWELKPLPKREEAMFPTEEEDLDSDSDSDDDATYTIIVPTSDARDLSKENLLDALYYGC